jgi:hypothetical protein
VLIRNVVEERKALVLKHFPVIYCNQLNFNVGIHSIKFLSLFSYCSSHANHTVVECLLYI